MATSTDTDHIVRTDMERIFRPLSGRQPIADAPTRFDREGLTRRTHARAGAARWITWAAPALLILFIAAFAVRQLTADFADRSAPNSPAERVAQRSAVPPRAEPIAPPEAEPRPEAGANPPSNVEDAPRPSRATPAPVFYARVEPRSEPDGARPAVAPSPAPRARETAPRARETARPALVAASDLHVREDASRSASTPAPAARPGGTREAVAARPSPAPRPAAVAPSVRPVRRPQLASSPAPARCTPGSEEDHCIYRDVLTAHNRLSASYERARRSGVPGLYLYGVKVRWERARRIAEDEPDEAIARYNGLADFLDRSSRGEP